MKPIDQVTEYLIDKVNKINVNNPKANSGGVLLKLHKTYQEDMDLFVNIALQTIQILFTKDTSDSPAGTSQLTNTSFKIGQHIHRVLKRDKVPWSMELRLGDLFVEAFYNCGYVDLYYPRIRDSSHIMSATPKWIELADLHEATTRINLTATITTIPKSIHSMVQRDRHLVIKNKLKDEKLDLKQPYITAMNKLQQSGWRINRRVYEALVNNKSTFLREEPYKDNDAKEMKRRSKTMEWKFIMSKAKLLENEDVFYQYVDADYRGRVYYIEPFLNFQGSDLSRGMLKFARGKPMTDDGLFWLAVHTAVSYNESYKIDDMPEWVEQDYKAYLKSEELDDISVDKMTLEDRVNWVNNNMDWIVDLGRTASFVPCEKTVSFLACCIEWYDYHEAKKDHRLHMTHLPIPIDGSNNGWQHLGSISKDQQTGDLVGLIPIKIPKDFYVQTAKELIKLTSDERLRAILSSMPMKHIRKGITKRGSMTRAYSAGAGKIAENMFFDCKAEDYHTAYDITQDDCNKFAKILIKAIDKVCPGPLNTMAYLQRLASFEIGKYKKFSPDGEPAGKEYTEIILRQKELYIKKDKSNEELEELSKLVQSISSYESRKIYGNGADRICWTTPSGFPVEYTNFQMQRRKAKGTINGYTTYNKRGAVQHCAQVATKLPDIRGFMTGISPNFVHSMDASHMALVVNDWNGEFGAVHDSFSTHACDVELLLAHTKRKFIDMYDIDNFYAYIEDELITDKEGIDVEQPELGSLNINDIENSDYFFA